MATSPEQQLGDQLDGLERKIQLLKVEYDKYFMGIVKKPPTKEREEIESFIRNFGRATIKNTAINYRFQGLKARFLTFEQYWQRILKQIEDGTFKRDQFRYSLKQKEEELTRQQEEARKLEEQRMVEEKRSEEAKRSTRDTIEDRDSLNHLFKEFLLRRQECRERTDNVQYEKMVDFMKQQTDALKQKYSCRAVEFQVVVDAGKTKLKAVPIK